MKWRDNYPRFNIDVDGNVSNCKATGKFVFHRDHRKALAALDSALKEMDRLAREFERLQSGYAGMFGYPGKPYCQDAYERGGEMVDQALSSHTQWRKENLGDDYE